MEPQQAKPLYAAIMEHLRQRITAGDWAEGTKLPSETSLIKEFEVSRTTARKALDDLEAEGYVTRSQGKGSFVAPMANWGRGTAAPDGPPNTLALTVYETEIARHQKPISKGFMQQALNLGYLAVLHGKVPGNDISYIHQVAKSDISGLAYFIGVPDDTICRELHKLQDKGIPIVLWDRYLPGEPFDYVVTNNDEMMFTLTSELIRRGHKRIGYLTFPHDNTAGAERYGGYVHALEQGGIPLNEELVVFCPALWDLPPSSEQRSRPEVQPYLLPITRLLGRPVRPDAIICATDYLAERLLIELEQLGYSVPSDIEVAFVDDARLAQHLSFPVLTATQPEYEAGQLAARFLIRRLEDPAIPQQTGVLTASYSFQ